MGTALYSLGPMQGARLWLLFWLAAAVCCLGVCLAVRANRTRRGLPAVLWGLLLAEVLVDGVWVVLYSRNVSWLHYGIGGVYGLLLWVPLLALAAVAVTARNKRWK